VLWERSVVEQRYDAVREVLDGRGVTEVAARYGVSRQSVYTWVGRYRAGGLAGLQDRTHRPNHSPDKTSAEVEAAVCELRRTHPGWGPQRLGWELERARVGPTPSRVTIWRILARNGLVDPQRRRRRRDYRPWEREAPMSLWQMDIMGGVWLEDGTECKLVTGIDDHSRYCVVAHLVSQATGRAVCQALVDGLRAWGLPTEVLTDNGVQFTGRYAKPRRVEVLFEQILRDNGITHRRTKVRSPTTTGKVERFHQTLRRELLEPAGPFASLEQAQKAVDAWVEVYNHQRPHQALGMAVPASRFRPRQGDPGEPGLVVPCDADPPPPAGDPGPVELEVLVPASGNLQLVGRQVGVGRALAAHQVRIWADLRSIHLSTSSDGRLLKTLPSRYSPDELALLHGHPTAHPAGPAPSAAAALQGAAVVEVDRVVNGCGLLGIGGRQVGVGLLWAGRQVTVRVEPTLLQVVCDGRVVKTLPSPVAADQRHRLRGARVAGLPPEPAAGPVAVQRVVSQRGQIQVGSQRLQVGLRHARKRVTVLAHEDRFEVLDHGELLTSVTRTVRKEVTRFKASEHQARQG
jgi:transposase InsO family protein